MEAVRGEKRKRDPREASPARLKPEREQQRVYGNGSGINGRRAWSTTDQARVNKLQEDERHREFLAKEGQFVLQQKRKAADIRVKEGRAGPIDWLAVNLRIIDPLEDLINDDLQEQELDYVDPESVVDRLSSAQLVALQKDVDGFLDIERKPGNREYWKTMKIICADVLKGTSSKAVRPVSANIDNLLRPKTYDELEKLEKQINRKLDSDEPIDVDYWQQLLESLLVYKAKAKLKKLYQSVLDTKLKRLRQENALSAETAKAKLKTCSSLSLRYTKDLDPDPLLQLNLEDKLLSLIDEQEFLRDIAVQRGKVLKTGYIPAVKPGSLLGAPRIVRNGAQIDSRISTSLFDREVAKGVEEDEEVFAGEEHVETKDAKLWTGKYRPRKPRYFNRVQMGYEWNKYNQTHYDHDNPPPKVVQGYKFHIFYPDLIDPARAPTYKIIREDGRKKGETVAPAGEEDTCIIRFMSGPPYEDIAFRIVDRDWDYSAKHERGFKSTFEKGILTLHFSFKKVYYRK